MSFVSCQKIYGESWNHLNIANLKDKSSSVQKVIIEMPLGFVLRAIFGTTYY